MGRQVAPVAHLQRRIPERQNLRGRISERLSVADDGCWLWTGGNFTRNGYARIWVDNRRVMVHRLLYEIAYGPIADGLVLDHLCRVRRCVNPAHLEEVTSGENVLRGEGASAVNARRTHCVNGHPFDQANTYERPNGNRACRTCRREARRRCDARQREARS